ncbi:MAG TPA: asparagine synthase C-terminal domain-containing protein [Sphingomicrobium sp.]|nr:asparagine synthase C-terminal domain-containing protein [Sphingomicrobium sp.]
MTLRFLAAAGSETALEQAAIKLADAPLSACATLGGILRIWTFPGTPMLFGPKRSRALVGRLVDPSTGTLHCALPPSNSPDRILCEHWGSYVLFEAQEDGHCLLRDPSGAIPVYCARSGGLDLYASDFEALTLLLPPPYRPDAGFIAHWLAYPFLRTARTGIAGVSELLPGMLRAKGPGSERTTLAWDPFRTRTDANRPDLFAAAADRLREVALETIPALARDCEPLALQLSGGLDSSIVAACLSAAGRRFRAVTFATLGDDGDERPYARMVAGHFEVALAELVEAKPTPLADAFGEPSLRPRPNALLQPLHRAIARELLLAGTGVVADGAGGDNVFAFLNTATPALDALWARGPRAAVRTLQQLAEVHCCTFWRAAGFAARRLLRRSGPWPKDVRFLGGAVPRAPDDHPWLLAASNQPVGTKDHMRMIVGIHHFLADPAPNCPETLHPLLAQPLLELCLAIPTWLWVHGGRDRAVARAAFADLLPSEILERRGKGRLESMFVRGYMTLRSDLADLLLEGRLNALGLLDQESVRAYLEQPGEPQDSGYVRLLEMASAEQWLRSFEE